MGDNKFSFSNTADEFDEHISKSIRGYTDLRDDVVGISKYFLEPNTSVLDLGCSQGTLIERVARENVDIVPIHYYGIEINPAFQKSWSNPDRGFRSSVLDSPRGGDISRNDYLKKYPVETHDVWLAQIGEGDEKGNIGIVHLRTGDVLDWLNEMPRNQGSFALIDPNSLSFAISLFTIQFLPERHRLEILQKVYDSLIDGGAFVISEKIFADNVKTQDMMDSLYYDFKRQSFSEKEILDKEQELRHLAKLNTEEQLISNLGKVGFEDIQVFWKNFNFVGVLATKRPKKRI